MPSASTFATACVTNLLSAAKTRCPFRNGISAAFTSYVVILGAAKNPAVAFATPSREDNLNHSHESAGHTHAAFALSRILRR